MGVTHILKDRTVAPRRIRGRGKQACLDYFSKFAWSVTSEKRRLGLSRWRRKFSLRDVESLDSVHRRDRIGPADDGDVRRHYEYLNAAVLLAVFERDVGGYRLMGTETGYADAGVG